MEQWEINKALEKNRGTAVTNHKDFEDYGFLYLEDFIDIDDMVEFPSPGIRGREHYNRKDGFQFRHDVDEQVPGSLSRYLYPKYSRQHKLIGKKISKILNTEVLPSYFYDRFYFAGHELKKHIDRDSCEISVNVHISSTFRDPWPVYFQDVDKAICEYVMKPGDAMIYKGCEVTHWREPNKVENPNLYYHSVFFHYVLRNGYRAHFAFEGYK